MINKTMIKSSFKKFAIDLYKNLSLCLFMCLLGVMCAMGSDLWKNETTNTLMGCSLFVSIIALFISNFFIVENARESRKNNKKKIFSDYCDRFSSNQNLCKVAEWLLAIAEFDSNGNLIDVHPKKQKDEDGRSIIEPTYFERKLFFDFLVELNVQIKSMQLSKEDVGVYFSSYVLIFKEILRKDDKTSNYLGNLADLPDLT